MVSACFFNELTGRISNRDRCRDRRLARPIPGGQPIERGDAFWTEHDGDGAPAFRFLRAVPGRRVGGATAAAGWGLAIGH